MFDLEEYNRKINSFLNFGKVQILECTTARCKCKIKCLECGKILEFSNLGNVMNRAKSQGWICKCGQIEKRKEEYRQKISNIFSNEDFEILEFNGFTKKSSIKCNKCGAIQNFAYAKLIYSKKHICSSCYPPKYEENKKIKDRFMEYIKNSKKWVLLEDTLDGKKTNDYIKCKCKKCGDINYKTFAMYMNGVGCAKCSGLKRLTTEEFKSRLDDDYELLSEYKNSHTKVLLRHTECGFVFKMTPSAYMNQFQRCPRCKRKESMGERLIRDFLEKNKIDYIKEYPVDIDGRHLRFDFYLPKEGVYIEFNGQQHYKITKFSPTEEALKDGQYRDKLKKDYCGDKLLVITYKEIKQIPNILQKQEWFNDYAKAVAYTDKRNEKEKDIV